MSCSVRSRALYELIEKDAASGSEDVRQECVSLLRCMDRWADVMPVPASRQVKTLEQMPGPSVAGFIWDLFFRRGLSRLHQLQLEGRRKYGPMWKASFGPILTVHVAEPELIEQVLRQEGQHPMRSDLSSWKDYRKLRGEGYGLLTAWGSPSVLFESRIGCLDPVVPVETERFIQSINTMFVMTLLTMAMPQWLHRLLPKPWETFCRCWDYMFQFAKGHIDQRLVEERKKMARGERLEGRYLTYFLSQTGVPLKSVYSNVTELLLAGVDTISCTLSWSLYELSRHPDIQTALRDEVLCVMKGRSVPEAHDVAAMPLMKAVMKEILRLYPVIPANARVITDKDITVGGYLIPRNTLITLCHYATSRDPKQFNDPDAFIPQRWLSRSEGSHPYASVPFGVGKRSCIGRRIAELEVYLALSRILMHFNVEPAEDSGPVLPMTRTLLVPERQINLRFIER